MYVEWYNIHMSGEYNVKNESGNTDFIGYNDDCCWKIYSAVAN